MDKQTKFVLCCVAVAVAINLVLPHVVAPLATPEQVNPPHGAKNLSFVSQVVHMLVHHAHVPASSSVIVALIVGLSVVIAKRCL